MSAGTGDHREAHPEPTLNLMTERGSQLLEAHIRSLDPGEATAQERLAEVIGEQLAQRLLSALRPH